MKIRLSHQRMLRIAGFAMWLSVGLPLLIRPFSEADIYWTSYFVWLVAYLLFGLSNWQVTKYLGKSGYLHRKAGLLIMMTVTAMAVSVGSGSALGGVLMLVTAGLLPWLLSITKSIMWLVVQAVLLVLVYANMTSIESSQNIKISEAIYASSIFFGFWVFTYTTSLVAMNEARARSELRKVNSELRATQELLGESTRIAERVRISRELHDLVGHHLTALSLNLEVASHLAKGKVLEHVSQSQSLAKLLLSDVREVVGKMRSGDAIDLSKALKSLVVGVPMLTIEMDIPTNFATDDPQRAQVLLRCVQEIITNTVKHANASRLCFKFERNNQGLSFHAHDDGQGVEQIRAGNGLTGMRERFVHFGGSLSVDSIVGEGFSVSAYLPKRLAL